MKTELLRDWIDLSTLHNDLSNTYPVQLWRFPQFPHISDIIVVSDAWFQGGLELYSPLKLPFVVGFNVREEVGRGPLRHLPTPPNEPVLYRDIQ